MKTRYPHETPADIHAALMENDLPKESPARNVSLSSHSQDDHVSIKGSPFLPRPQSLGNLPGASRNASAVAGSSFSQLGTQLKEMEQARACETQVNAQLDASKQHWQQLRKAYRKSRTQYENAIDPFNMQLDDASADQNIAELRGRFINDRSNLESYAADVRMIKRKLQAAQSSRGQLELTFMQSAHQWAKTPISNALPESAGSLTSAQTPRRIVAPSFTPPSEVEVLLERYHSKLAAVESLGERLTEHNYEYWNEVARRELRRDRGESLSFGDDDFEEVSEQDKNGILQELSMAMEEATQLKIVCASAGADVQSLEPSGLTFAVSPDFANIGYDDSLQATLAKIPVEALKDVENVRGDMSENESVHSESGRASELVKSWMDRVPLPQDTPIF